MTQVALNEALRPPPPYFQPEAFTRGYREGIVPPSRPRTEQEKRELRKQTKEALLACQLEAEQNGINDLTAEEFHALVYGD